METRWLAVGDEAGGWDSMGKPDGGNKRPLGVSLTLASLDAWHSLDQEFINDRKAKEALDSPQPGLPYQDRKDARHLHVKDALRYLKGKGLNGAWSLAEPAEDPVKAGLLAALRWLDGHHRFVTLGAYARLPTIRRHLHLGDDPAQALGQMYGHVAALIMPFLGPKDHLYVSPGLRSEADKTKSIPELRASTSKNMSQFPGKDGDRPRPQGDTRGMFTACKDTALKLLGGWRPAGIFEQRLDIGTVYHFKNNTPGWPNLSYNALNGAADLGASLMSMRHFPHYDIKLDPRCIINSCSDGHYK